MQKDHRIQNCHFEIIVEQKFVWDISVIRGGRRQTWWVTGSGWSLLPKSCQSCLSKKPPLWTIGTKLALEYSFINSWISTDNLFYLFLWKTEAKVQVKYECFIEIKIFWAGQPKWGKRNEAEKHERQIQDDFAPQEVTMSHFSYLDISG